MAEKISGKASETSSDEIDLGRLLGTLLDNRWLIIGVTALFTIIGIMYVTLKTPIYKADALIQVEQSSGNSLLNDLSSMLPEAKPQSAAEIELIKSRMVIGKTIKDLSLDTVVQQKYFPIVGKGLARIFEQEPGKIAISRLEVPASWLDESFELTILSDDTYEVSSETVNFSGSVGRLESNNGISLLVSDIKAPAGTVFLIRKQSDLSAINNLLGNFSVEDKGKSTGVLQLSLEGEDPATTNKILNSISQNYFKQNVERKSEEAGKSLAFLEEQLPSVRESLNEAENKLNKFRQQNDSVDLSLEAKAVLDTTVSVESQLNELTFKEAEISKLYTREHPAYKALLEKRVTLEQERDKLNRRIGSMPKTQQEILRLTRDVQAGQDVYMQLLNKQQELSINKASTVGYVRIIDTAVTQPKPVKPRKTLLILLSFILGGVVSVAFVAIKTLLHKGIESPEQLEELGINVYASVPLSEWQQKKDRALLSRGKKGNTRSTELLAVGNPADLAIEAIRSLRTSLHFAMMEAKNNVLMISGASPAIGKTFVSANLGAVVAQAGQRVLIVDCDMRKGYAHELMGCQGNDGLSDILSGQMPIEKSIRKTAIENMDFISRGQIPPNPSELLMHIRFSEFIKWASENYDLVLLDTPPILAVTDAAIISRHAGTSLLVARFEVNTLKEIEVSIRRFEQNGAEIKGVILNAIVKRAASYYGYGNYNYYAYEYKSEK
ncbi:tyrosine-protein kinase Wzc [Pectobacterium carotovorum]|uniref:tyrosine-protein kinase Wzc n=1 Tax=Pectobacterium carotovorum TaxID=554 RepID=UPI000500E5CD|nr:tyrosine-protein kinase Wzc [Pectobacterium carotovorum]KFW99301.1 tyrosine protein kinase [Pectobacterium carotovorum subsp. carotovorum]KML70906.1 tyrosine protein kinase [Pectobacterium carotovorum subsp. carotovorum ICMP 5702]MBA0174968.1 tyrosine-protein kinase Wzc [Pectobacterium carotovorum]MCQ8231674.1 tyrosine-protein kinase Wzc [Pectobacterium carotovorum]SHH10538.1 tyrosine-protein kinase Etk/Wzc [Pectobacterium carotovorum]